MSQSEIIYVEPEKLRIAAKQITQLAEDYNIRYNEVLNRISEIQVDYQGIDSRTFLEKVSGFRNEFTKMKAEIDLYAEHLIQTAKEHEEAIRINLENAKKLIGGNS